MTSPATQNDQGILQILLERLGSLEDNIAASQSDNYTLQQALLQQEQQQQ
jgi:hypothetical protein